MYCVNYAQCCVYLLRYQYNNATMTRSERKMFAQKRNAIIVTRYMELINMGLNKTGAIGKMENQKKYGSLSKWQISNILRGEGF